MSHMYICNNRIAESERYYDRSLELVIFEKGQLIAGENRLGHDVLVDHVRKANVSNNQRNWNIPIVTESQTGALLETQSEHSQIPIQNKGQEPVTSPTAQVNQTESGRMAVTPQDQTSSHLSQNDDSYYVPNHSSGAAPRMIQQGQQGRSVTMNAFRRLKNMSNAGKAPDKMPSLPAPGDLGPFGYPTTKVQEAPTKGYPGTKEYQATRFFCCWTTFLIVLIIVCTLTTAAVAVFGSKKECTAVSAALIITDIIALVIAVLEWVRLWIWREPLVIRQIPSVRRAAKANAASSMGPVHGSSNLPAIANEPGPVPNMTYTAISNDEQAGGLLTHGFQERLYDVPKFISAIFLILLYFAGAFSAICTLAASVSNMKECEMLSIAGLGFSAFAAVFILLRMMFCCLSDACQGVCFKTAQATSSGIGPVPMVAINQLHQNLPDMGRQTANGDSGTQPTAWLLNLATASDPRQHLSICQPMPAKFSQDFTP